MKDKALSSAGLIHMFLHTIGSFKEISFRNATKSEKLFVN